MKPYKFWVLSISMFCLGVYFRWQWDVTFNKKPVVEKVRCPDISDEAMVLLDSLSDIRLRICRNAFAAGYQKGRYAQMGEEMNRHVKGSALKLEEQWVRDSAELEQMLILYWR